MKTKLSLGSKVTCLTALLTLVALIVYAINVNGSGYFRKASVYGLVVMTLLAVLCYVGAILLKQVSIKAVPEVCVDLVTGLMQIAAPVLVAVSLVNLIAGRVEGLGFIYFSNPDVILEVQTPANMSSAHGAIASMVCFGVAMLCGMIAAFFRLGRKAE